MRLLRKEVVLWIHHAGLEAHGGAPGIRDRGLLDSALARPGHKLAYEEPDIYDVAAAYAYGISRNHPFLDSNKRTAWASAVTVLRLNGADVTAPDQEKHAMMLALAQGEIDEGAFANWLRP